MLRELLSIPTDNEEDNKGKNGGGGATEKETQTGGRRDREWCKTERITNECLAER